MHEFNSSRILLKVEKDKMSELLAPIVEEILFFVVVEWRQKKQDCNGKRVVIL